MDKCFEVAEQLVRVHKVHPRETESKLVPFIERSGKSGNVANSRWSHEMINGTTGDKTHELSTALKSEEFDSQMSLLQMPRNSS
ncbi:hypothetical protein KIN20_013919 [Parelaphostrongylus tenuis]|uniref:Uncharacterized protein n=1 Tax=Parelaphostrongylus tenuis TaxID=148309 RepID=A0AAD5QNX2_PARTN|nr:hypothetical protein KIN20_013919 [Parelaphostrongylus tenuis]